MNKLQLEKIDIPSDASSEATLTTIGPYESLRKYFLEEFGKSFEIDDANQKQVLDDPVLVETVAYGMKPEIDDAIRSYTSSTPGSLAEKKARFAFNKAHYNAIGILKNIVEINMLSDPNRVYQPPPTHVLSHYRY